MFLIQGLHHCGAFETTGAQHLLQVFQFLVLPAVMARFGVAIPQGTDYSNQDPWMAVRVEVDVMVGVSFRLKHQSMNQGIFSFS